MYNSLVVLIGELTTSPLVVVVTMRDLGFSTGSLGGVGAGNVGGADGGVNFFFVSVLLLLAMAKALSRLTISIMAPLSAKTKHSNRFQTF
jgi:hypothetical protein